MVLFLNINLLSPLHHGYCNQASYQMFNPVNNSNCGLQSPDNLLSRLKYNLEQARIIARKKRIEISPIVEETQLNFNIKLSEFIENIITEKKEIEDKFLQLENRIIQLENKKII